MATMEESKLNRQENARRITAINQCLVDIEQVLRQYDYWQVTPPPITAFASEQPFFLDNLAPCEWLQWVLLPRLQQLIAAEQPLPLQLAVTAYFEQTIAPEAPIYLPLIAQLQALDRLFLPG